MKYQCSHLWLLAAVWFEATDKEGMAGRQSLHQGVQRVSELATEGGRVLGSIGVDLRGAVGEIMMKNE